MTMKLEDTCLCAIVRDEKVNPAGGILDYVESVVPYVNAAVIVDTGSIDGTREILEECEGKYSNLTVCDRKFKGFSDARNYSLKMGKKFGAEYALVLDADERLTGEDFEVISYCMGNFPSEDSYVFDFHHVSFENGAHSTFPEWNHRLFRFNNVRSFSGRIYETLNFFQGTAGHLPVEIKHFLSSFDGRSAKSAWYNKIRNMFPEETSGRKAFEDLEPMKHQGFDLWKEVNPYREIIR